ncbi:MAG: hypothetical protein J2P33_07220, partial [Actinobacteria bacterium]|nr:hypothetical protein [Actinomycetota bacterium]
MVVGQHDGSLPGDLGFVGAAPGAEPYPAQEAGPRLLERDRGSRQVRPRPAGFANTCGRRPSPALRKVIEGPAQCAGQAAPGWTSVSLRHISIMRLLDLESQRGFTAAPH